MKARIAGLVAAAVLAASGCGEEEPGQQPPATSSPTPVSTTPSPPPPPAPSTTSSTRATTKRSTPAANGPGCGQRAVNAGKFNPECPEYQGYLDPGGPGRGKTSGDLQREYGCEQGYIPKSEC